MAYVVARDRWQSLGVMLKRRLLQWLLARRGVGASRSFAVIPGDVVSDEIIVAGLYEESVLHPLFSTFLAAWSSRFEAGVAVDVGANIGNHTVFFSKLFAQVVSFEPNPIALALLRCNVDLAGLNERVRIMPIGLGDRGAILSFRNDEEGNLGASGFEVSGIRRGRQMDCEVRRGDDVLSATDLMGPIALIKLDIEGGELAALQGLDCIIGGHKPVILFETHRSTGPAGALEILAYLRSKGYEEFFAVEEPAVTGKSPLRRLLSRALLGERMEWRPFVAPQDRFYQLVAALPKLPEVA